MSKYIYAGLGGIIVMLLGFLLYTKQQVIILKKDLEVCKTQKMQLQTAIDTQNLLIQKANESLAEYNATLSESKAKYDRQIKQANLDIKKLRTCEQRFSYLKQILEKIQ